MAVDLRWVVQNCLLDQLVVSLQTPVFSNETLNFHVFLFLEHPLCAYLLLKLLNNFLWLNSLLIKLSNFKLKLLLWPGKILEITLSNLYIFPLSLELFVLLSVYILELPNSIKDLFVLGSDFLFNQHLALEILLQFA